MGYLSIISIMFNSNWNKNFFEIAQWLHRAANTTEEK